MTDLNSFTDSLNRKIGENKNKSLFLCIGTNDILWDSLGPRIGTFLKEDLDSEYVLGDINNNIICLDDLITNYSKIKNKYVIAIDSAITKNEMLGKIFISNKPLVMGLGVNKNKGVVGNMSIKIAICNSSLITQKYINNLARNIAGSIVSVVK